MWNPLRNVSDTLSLEAFGERGGRRISPLSFVQYPIFWVALSVTLGFVVGTFLRLPFLPLFVLLGGLFAVQVLSLPSRAFVIFTLAGFGVFGMLFSSVVLDLPGEYFWDREGQNLVLEGYVVERDGRFTLVRLQGFPVYSPGVLLRGKEDILRPLLCRKVEVTGLFRGFPSCANPGGRDLREHFRKRRIVGYLEVREISPSPSRSLWFAFLRWVHEKRGIFLDRWQHLLLETSPLFNALLFGVRGEEFLQTFPLLQEIGVYHLFCVSGFHMALLGTMLFSVFQRLLPRRMVLFGVLPFTFLYLAFCGFVASASRAWIMASLLLLGRRLGRTVTTMGVLCSAFLVMFLLQPEMLFLPGAQLSFASTVGIAVFAAFLPRRKEHRKWRELLSRYVLGVLLATASATFASFPFLVGNQFSLSSLVFLGNLVALPLVEGVLFLGLWTPVLGTFAYGRLVLGFCLRCLLQMLLEISVFLRNSVPHWVADFSRGRDALWGMVAWGIIVVLGVSALTRKRVLRFFSLCPVLGGLVLGSLWFPKMSFLVFDVGQGLACGLFEGNTGVFIDTGGVIRGYGNVGESILLPFLRFRGITEIRGVFLTHGHRDHAGGVTALQKVFPEAPCFSPADFSSLTRLRLSPHILLEVFPVSDRGEKAVVYRLHTPYGRVLVCGDAEGVFEEIAPRDSSLLRAEVLVLPHHGSYNTSLEALIRASGCLWAIISVGENPYGHPDPRTVALLEKLRIPYFITERDGAVEFYPLFRRGRIRRFGKAAI